MFDNFNRPITYLRVSVTDRCNLRCAYCMPSGGFNWIPHGSILRFEEIVEVVEEATRIGIHKVRLTGGEPLVRKNITTLVKMISEIPGITDLSMTTNGVLLNDLAGSLKAAGLNRINISLDTTEPGRFRQITGMDRLQEVIDGIDAAIRAGLSPVKLNCVVKKNRNEPDAIGVSNFAKAKGLEVRYIHQMSLSHGHFGVVEGGEGGNCAICNRLRLTANGFIKPCLFSDLQYPVRELGARNALLAAVSEKPACGTANKTNQFNNIGG